MRRVAPAPEVIRLGDVTSTNDEAMARLRESGLPVWVSARRQTGGRGRRGRPWVSEPGNLYASHAFPAAMPADSFAFLPLAAAVALCEAVARATGLSPRVKWPNDLLLDGRKVAGILCESEIGGASGTRRAVLGFGVNVAHAPAGMPATRLADHAPEVTAEDLLNRLVPAVATALGRLDGPDGVAELLARWRAAAVGIGEPVTVRLETATMEGRFVDLDETGRLVLEGADGTLTRIAAGDVFVRAEAP